MHANHNEYVVRYFCGIDNQHVYALDLWGTGDSTNRTVRVSEATRYRHGEAVDLIQRRYRHSSGVVLHVDEAVDLLNQPHSNRSDPVA